MADAQRKIVSYAQPVRRPSLQSEDLRQLLECWNDWPRKNGIPLRAALDPLSMPKLLPHVLLASVERQGDREYDYDIVFRYIGSSVEALFDMYRYNDLSLSSFGPAYAERWFPVFHTALEERQPAYFVSSPQGIEKDYISFEMITLPLTAGTGDVDFILAGFIEFSLPIRWM